MLVASIVMICAIASIVGLVFLIIFAAKTNYNGDRAWDIVSFTIFGVGLILLYTFSSLYHLLNVGEKATIVFRKFDHIMIYIYQNQDLLKELNYISVL